VKSFAQRHVYAIIALGLLTVFLVIFIVAEQLQVPLLTDPEKYLDQGSWLTGVLGIGLLVGDVILPVPSSGVMVLQGAAYGVIWGAVLSLIGGTGATLVAFFVGRRSRVAVDRVAGPEQQRRASDLLDRYGIWAVIVSRPVPMLAETVGIVAGAGGMRWWQVGRAGALGNVLPAIAYAAVGAYSRTFASGAVVFLLVLLVATSVWILQVAWRKASRHTPGQEPPTETESLWTP
jgi:uncharacterized membrane protein YdjX (TVP38/TMEM64 family)